MTNYKVAVFDLDGTLLDTSEGIKASVGYTIEHFGFAPLPDEEMDQFIGPPIQNSFARAYGLEGPILQEIATVFRNRYKDVDLLKAVPYEGIFEVFQQLEANGIKTAVATYKRQDYATMILEHFGFHNYTSIMYGADHENKLTKADIIKLALKDAGVTDYRQAVMIGDSDNDAIGAQNIGTDFLGVTYGFGFKHADDIMQFSNIGIATNTSEITKILIGKGE